MFEFVCILVGLIISSISNWECIGYLLFLVFQYRVPDLFSYWKDRSNGLGLGPPYMPCMAQVIPIR